MLRWLFRKTFRTPGTMSASMGEYFKNADIQKEFCTKGYVIFRDWANQELDTIEKLYENYKSDKKEGFYYSIMNDDEAQKIFIHEQLSEIIRPGLKSILNDFELYSSTFLVKPAKSYTEMALHQDWSFTDERAFTPISFWLPLQDVTTENGCIFLLPHSHLLYENYRSNAYNTLRVDRKVIAGSVVDICLKKGDLLLFNPAVFHGSNSNITDQERVSCTVTVLPSNAPLLYYHKKNKKESEVRLIDKYAYLKQLTGLKENEGLKGTVMQNVRYTHHVISPEDFVEDISSLSKQLDKQI